MNYNYTLEANELFNNNAKHIFEYDFSKMGLEELEIEKAAAKIIELVKNQEKIIKKSFPDYLKRYLVKSMGVKEDDQIDFILNKQKENKLKNGNSQLLSKQRLEKCYINSGDFTPSRDYIFRLAFILDMQPEAVEEFLQKGIGDRGFNFKNPLEVICWHCLKQNYGFLKVQDYINMYNSLETATNAEDKYTLDIYNDYSKKLTVNPSDQMLREILSEVKKFAMELYGNIECGTIECYNHRLQEEFNLIFEEIKSELQDELNMNITGDNDIENGSSGISTYLYGKSGKKDISLIDKKSIYLPDAIVNNRLTKGRLGDIVKGEKYASRQDLVTLCFLYNQWADIAIDMNPEDRLEDFCDTVNRKLELCGMQELNVNNIYEYFIMLCMSTEEPLMVFQEVFLQAINNREEIGEL